MRPFTGAGRFLPFFLLSTLPVRVLGSDSLSSDGFTMCLSDSTVQVDTLNVIYNRNTNVVNFDVAGSSTVAQNVSIQLTVTAYGKQVYSVAYDPCAHGVTQLCPIPAGSYSSQGAQTIPGDYASKIPSIAFSVPDLEGTVNMQLTNAQGQEVACLDVSVTNGNTFNTPTIKYVAAGVAAGALGVSLIGAAAVGGGFGGVSGPSPSFGEVMGWFQGLAINGMLSVSYPKVYQSFTTNFGFSHGLIPWGAMQTSIDNFRNATGGNLTDATYQYLKNNATLVYGTNSNSSGLTRRALDTALLWARDGTQVDINGTSSNINGGASPLTNANATSPADTNKSQHFVSGIQAFVESLSIPKANTFMTILLIWAIVVAAIIVGILLIKIILELYSHFGTLPKSLESWRKRYWWRLAKTLTNLILLLYGTWTLYCVYQFTNGDSWAAKLLAAFTLAIFTAVLAGFTYMIYMKAHNFRKMEGDTSRLYEDKEVWVKYSLFYDNYKRDYWWIFVPAIVYMFARGAVVAGANGHGVVQAVGQIIVEMLMLILLLWARPYQRASSQWINITIQVVRILSVVSILVFVEEFGVSQTTKTILGVILIVVQSVLTGLLAILVAVNAIITCIKENPHRRRRKEAEKLNREIDNLTPLDARNSLLMESMAEKGEGPEVRIYKEPIVTTSPFVGDPIGRYDPIPPRSRAGTVSNYSRPSHFDRDDDHEHLISSAASFGHYRDRSVSNSPAPSHRDPKLPDLDFGKAM